MSGVFLIIFTLFWSGTVLMFDGLMARGIYKQYESNHYPSVAGTISHSEVKSHRTSKGGTSYNAVIQYKFAVGGENFTGNKIRLGMMSSDRRSATAIVNAHPLGSAVTIFYNPANPQESLLSPGVKGSDFMLALFLTPFNMVMLGFWIWIGAWLREKFFKPAAGGVKVITDGMTTRIRLPQFPALAFGLGATGALGFISIFVVGFSTKMEPAIPLVLSVIGIIYAAGLIVYLWQLQKINSGIDDLIIHESAQTIELPLTFGRKQRVTANVADIESLAVEKIEHRSNKGGISYTYAPTLHLRQTDPATEKLADWSDKSRADEFTEWLRNKLGANIPATFVPAISEADNSADAPTLPAKILQPAHSKIRISDGANGHEFYFPAARNIGPALFATLFALIFSSAAVALFNFHAPTLFSVAFGFVGFLILCGAFSLWFKTSRITIDSTRVSATNHNLFFSRTRQFSTSEVAQFKAVAGMTSGSKTFYSLKLVTQKSENSFETRRANPAPAGQLSPLMQQRLETFGGITIASGIPDLTEANWLVQEMTQALGRE